MCNEALVRWGQQHVMNTNRNIKMLRASAIGAATVVLFASTGIAQAETNPTYFANPDGSLEVIYGGGGIALYATPRRP